MSRYWERIRSQGLSNEHAFTFAEMAEDRPLKQLVSFCNEKCAGGQNPGNGYPIGIGKVSHCPRCGAKVVFQTLCSRSQVTKYRAKFRKFS